MGKSRDKARCELTEILSKEEIRFRKFWLGLIAFRVVVLSIFGDFGYMSADVPDVVFCFFIGAIDFFLLYYSSYKKTGTSFLALHMILLGPWYGLKLLACFDFPVYGLSFFLTLIITGYFLLTCIKMRNINKKIQVYEFSKSECFRKSIDYIRSAQDLDSLTFKFHEALRECPGLFAAALAPVYDDMKRQFSKEVGGET